MRRWLIQAVLASVLLYPVASSARVVLAATPISRMDLGWWRQRHEAKLHELAEAKPQLIFLGDSITQDWELTGPPAWKDFAPIWQRFYGDRHAVNLGFKGDTTASLLWRIRNGEVAHIAPKAAVVLIGANNMGRPHWSAEDTEAGIEAIITELRTRLPSTKILLLAVLPSDRSAWVDQTTAEINKALAKRYKDGGAVTYMDLTALFMRNGALNKDLFLDGKLTPPDPPLHPTAQAQAFMAKAMEPILVNMLGDRPHN